MFEREYRNAWRNRKWTWEKMLESVWYVRRKKKLEQLQSRRQISLFVHVWTPVVRDIRNRQSIQYCTMQTMQSHHWGGCYSRIWPNVSSRWFWITYQPSRSGCRLWMDKFPLSSDHTQASAQGIHKSSWQLASYYLIASMGQLVSNRDCILYLSL